MKSYRQHCETVRIIEKTWNGSHNADTERCRAIYPANLFISGQFSQTSYGEKSIPSQNVISSTLWCSGQVYLKAKLLEVSLRWSQGRTLSSLDQPDEIVGGVREEGCENLLIDLRVNH
ncbi:hypothetical protein RRG08_049380 [Elysia crispata]|uniref:Uncharacterized protein n=1 Tax=Elysia crispata TaxID=231223 RepID=A0AAE0XDW4_9GAST|nr:hypothetical protein RRG08_049380 [Elysia crispata]